MLKESIAWLLSSHTFEVVAPFLAAAGLAFALTSETPEILKAHYCFATAALLALTRVCYIIFRWDGSGAARYTVLLVAVGCLAMLSLICFDWVQHRADEASERTKSSVATIGPPASPPVNKPNGPSDNKPEPPTRHSDGKGHRQQQIGNSNQQVGSISQQGRNNIAQIGNNNQATINETPPDRTWSPTQNQLDTLCKTPYRAHIASINDQEAIRFADRIARVLVDCGWTVDLGTGTYPRLFSGVWTKSHTGYPGAAAFEGAFNPNPVSNVADDTITLEWGLVMHVGSPGPISGDAPGASMVLMSPYVKQP